MVLPREDTVNTVFANILATKLRINAYPEDPRFKPKRFDVYFIYKFIEFVFEASYEEKDAEKDAKSRLESGIINTAAIAIHYDPRLMEDKLKFNEIEEVLYENPIKVKVFTVSKDVSVTLFNYMGQQNKRKKIEEKSGWLIIPITSIYSLLDSLIDFMINEDVLNDLSQEIEQKINIFISAFNSVLKQNKDREVILKNFFEIIYSPSKSENDFNLIIDISDEVLISNIYMSLFLSVVLYESVCRNLNLDSMQVQLIKNNNILITLRDSFIKILEKDYQPIFKNSLNIANQLFNFQNEETLIDRLKEIPDIVSKVIGNHAIMRQDFVGKIYHKITADIAARKGYATFFTKSPIASFLSTLIVETKNEYLEKFFSSPDEIKTLKIADMACGSGTLLSAMYNSILNKYIFNNILKSSIDPEDLHKTLIHQVLWGFDALPNSVQITSIVESLHNASVPLIAGDFHNYQVTINSSGSLGSLNYWYSNILIVFPTEVSMHKIEEKEIQIPKFDVIIMNPPFSRSTAPGRGGSRPRIFDFVTDKRGYENLWRSYSDLLKDITKSYLNIKTVKKKRKKNLFNSIYDKYVGKGKTFESKSVSPINAGASLPFIFLADKYLTPGGRIGIVVPKTVLENSSYFFLRVLLISKYSIDYIITSEEEGNSNFSYSTNISEALIVATKLDENKIRNKTTFVKLYKLPKNPLEGILMARQIASKDMNILKNYELNEVDSEVVKKFVWSLSFFTNIPEKLKKQIISILEGELFSKKIKTLSFEEISGSDLKFNIFDSRPLRGGQYSKFYISKPEDTNFKILKRCGREQMSKLSLDASLTESIEPRNAKGLEYFNNKSGYIVIPSSIRFNSLPLLASFIDKPLVSNVAYIAKAATRELEKAIVVWLNFTPLIGMLNSVFSTLEGHFGHLKVWQLKIIPFPDLSDKDLVLSLSSVYDNFANEYWKPFPEQFNDASISKDALRFRFDLSVLKTLNSEYDTEKLINSLTDIYIEMKNFLTNS